MANAPGETLRIEIVLASNRDGDRQMLEESIGGTPWRLVTASNLQQALESLHRVAIPMVLCDGQFDQLPWRILLRTLRKERRRACVILLTDPGSPELLSEVLQRGGFDVLTRPFRREEVFPTLVSGYAQCRMAAPFARMASREMARVFRGATRQGARSGHANA
jgi:DNA-binding NtrC family response regulator